MKSERALPIVSTAFFLVALGCKGGESASSGETAVAANAVPYSSVQAVLTDKCVGCHGANSPKGGVNLTSYETLMKGGEDGPIVKAGDPASSELIQVMRGAQGHKMMPPSGPPATAEQIKTVEDWIKAGAKSG